MTFRQEVEAPCDLVRQRVARALGEAGLRVRASFDLQTARRLLADPGECPCPHHGTDECACQYVVLLVEQPGEAPVVVVLHGREDYTALLVQALGPVRARSRHLDRVTDLVAGCLAEVTTGV